MNNPDIAVIIVNLNGVALLPECLESLAHQTYRRFKLYFVDNGSSDDSIEVAKSLFPALELIAYPKNAGFAPANNRAMRIALASPEIRHVICLNNDTKLEHDWLEQLVNAMDNFSDDSKVGMLASASFFPDGSIQNAGIDVIRDAKGRFVEAVARGANADPDDDAYHHREVIFGPSGNAALYSRRMLEEVGLFDDSFFAYLEDVDLALRANKRGFTCMYIPEARLIHYHSKTAGVASPLKAYLSKRNLYLMVIKNSPRIIDAVAFMFHDAVRMLAKRKGGKDASIATLEGRIGISGMIFLMMRIYGGAAIRIPLMLGKRWGFANDSI